IRRRVVEHLTFIDMSLAAQVAKGIGVEMPSGKTEIEDMVSDVKTAVHIKLTKKPLLDQSPALSMEITKKTPSKGAK
ncbi:MAG: hypothetical protein ACK4TA_15330, partial [Saprospiraceae bacterium]